MTKQELHTLLATQSTVNTFLHLSKAESLAPLEYVRAAPQALRY
jgi:hypothetical protein